MSTLPDSLTFAAVGDAIMTTEISETDHEQFDELVDLVRGTDAATVNLEVLLHDYEGYPTGASTGTYMRAPPKVADELTWMGFDLFAAASNHSGDYSHGGMEATMRALEQRDVPYAGLGRNLSAAMEPAYVETPAGRVALVAAHSTNAGVLTAGRQRQDLQGRPGVLPLGYEARYVVPDEYYDQVTRLSDELGLEDLKEDPAESSYPHLVSHDGEDYFDLPNITGSDLQFARGSEFGIELRADESDLQTIDTAIGRARRQADFVIASLHTHAGKDGHTNAHEPAAFVETAARRFVDAGADVFVGHGSHVLQGIDIYDGSPLFLGLGNFVLQNQLVTRLPGEIYDRYGLDQSAVPEDLFDERVYGDDGQPKGFLANEDCWESVLPVCEFAADGSVAEITLHPLDLQRENPRSRQGRPVVATGDRATDTLDGIADYSVPYGTEIVVEDGVGRVVL